MRLHAGAIDGAMKLLVAGHGATLSAPALPLTPPVVAQLTNTDTGVCWEATHAAPARNDAARFQSAGEGERHGSPNERRRPALRHA